MNGAKPLTLLQRETLQFIRGKAAEWVREFGNRSFSSMDPAELGKAIGGAQAIAVALCDAVPGEKP